MFVTHEENTMGLLDRLSKRSMSCLWCGKPFSPANSQYPTICNGCGMFKFQYEESGGLDPRDPDADPKAVAKIQKLISQGLLDETKHRESRRRVIKHCRETGQEPPYPVFSDE